MSDTHAIRCYEYVNRPYERVRDALTNDASGVFQRATSTAAGRAGSLIGELRVSIAGLEVGKNVVIEVKGVETGVHLPGRVAEDATQVDLAWKAETHAGLFPSMKASLLLYALSAGETQIELRGEYQPPGGVLGSAADRLVGHRIAEASVHRFLQDLVAKLSAELA